MRFWLDDRLVPESEARLPVTDHGLLYGDGVFEGIRAHGGRVFRLDDHLTRLQYSARAIGLELPLDREGLRIAVLETLVAFGAPDAYVRLLVTRGEGALGVDPGTCSRPRVVCVAAPVRLYPAETLARGISLATVSWRRPGPDVLDPRVKSLNYLNSVLAKSAARRAGADEALLLNAAGAVAEAAVANVFAVREGVVRTPPPSDGALDGITRRTVLEACTELGRAAEERTLQRIDLLAADEVFLTGTGAGGLVPVRSLDGAQIGEGVPGPITGELRAAYLARARAGGDLLPFPAAAAS